MATLLLLQLLLLSVATKTKSQSQTCRRSQCAAGSPIIRFPFRLGESQSHRCGYPGFDLSCNERNQTTIKFPMAGEFAVDFIDYVNGMFWIRDPENCMARRLLNNNFIVGVPFEIRGYESMFTFLNCTSDVSGTDPDFEKIGCLSGGNYTVGMVQGAVDKAGPCSVISSVQVPTRYPGFRGPLEDVLLGWVKPDCILCELQGSTCGYKRDAGFRVGCLPDSGTTNQGGLSRICTTIDGIFVSGTGTP